MKRLWPVLALLPLLLAGVAIKDEQINARQYLACDGANDDRARLAALVATGGVASGKRLFVPTGCTILLSSPGTSSPAVALSTDTTITFEEGSKVELAQKRCVGGDFPGAWCSTSADCPGSGSPTCDIQGASGTPAVTDVFAPTQGSTYTVFGAETNATGLSVLGANLETHQREPYGRCASGGNSGKVCAPRCSSLLNGAAIVCANDTICSTNSIGTCVGDELCDSTVCTGVPKNPSGTGNITVFGFSTASAARVERANVRNIEFANPIAAVGANGSVYQNRFDTYDTLPVPQAFWVGLPWSLVRSISAAVTASTGTNVAENTIRALTGINGGNTTNNKITIEDAGTIGIVVATDSTATGNTVTLSGQQTQVGIKTTGQRVSVKSNHVIGDNGSVSDSKSILVQVAGVQGDIIGNQLIEGGYGIIPAEDLGLGAINNNITGNRIWNQHYVGIGATTGWVVSGNYFAWTDGMSLQVGFANSTTYYPNVHGMFTGNLFHTDTANAGPLVTFTDFGKRCAARTATTSTYNTCSVDNDCRYCTGGSNAGTLCPAGTECTGGGSCVGAKMCSNSANQLCTVNNDCRTCSGGSNPGTFCPNGTECTGGGTCGGSATCNSTCTSPIGYAGITFSGNTFYTAAPGAVAMQVNNDSGLTPYDGIVVTGNSFDLAGGDASGPVDSRNFVFPSSSANRDTIKGFAIFGNTLGNQATSTRTDTNFVNWDWRMGTIGQNEALWPEDEQVTISKKHSGSTVDFANKAVVPTTTADSVTAGSISLPETEKVLGVAKTFISSISSPKDVKVATSGVTLATVNGKPDLTAGDRLKIPATTSGATAGVGVKADAWEPAYATALQAYTSDSDGTVRVEVGQSPGRPEDPIDQIHLYDEFMAGPTGSGPYTGTVGSLGWSTVNEGTTACTAGTTETLAGGTSRPGSFALGTNGSSARGCYLSLTDGSLNTWDLLPGYTWRMISSVRPKDTANLRTFVGFTDALTGFVTNDTSYPQNLAGAMFSGTSTTSADTHWYCTVCVSGSCSRTAGSTSASVADTTNFRRIELRHVANGYGSCSQAGGCLECKVDGESIVHNAAIPTASLQPFFGATAHSTGAKQLEIDYFDLRAWGLQR